MAAGGNMLDFFGDDELMQITWRVLMEDGGVESMSMLQGDDEIKREFPLPQGDVFQPRFQAQQHPISIPMPNALAEASNTMQLYVDKIESFVEFSWVGFEQDTNKRGIVRAPTRPAMRTVQPKRGVAPHNAKKRKLAKVHRRRKRLPLKEDQRIKQRLCEQRYRKRKMEAIRQLWAQWIQLELECTVLLGSTVRPLPSLPPSQTPSSLRQQLLCLLHEQRAIQLDTCVLSSMFSWARALSLRFPDKITVDKATGLLKPEPEKVDHTTREEWDDALKTLVGAPMEIKPFIFPQIAAFQW